VSATLAALACLPHASFAQSAAAPKGRVETVKVHGRSLDGNLSGEPADREVSIYLPPSYDRERSRRYPVVILLHGYSLTNKYWVGTGGQGFASIDVPGAMDRDVASDKSREMILVMPDGNSKYDGSMYSSSVTSGDWESFIADDLVGYVDGHYSTIANRASRGLAGHSMGGYGAIRIGMKHPEVYSALYLLSPCCMEVSNVRPNPAAEAIRDPGEVAKAPFFTKAVFASAAAWSPNPKNPPLFLDLPYKNGELRPEIVAKWQANAPLAMIDQYISNLRQYAAIGMDAGTQDHPIVDSVGTLDRILIEYGIPHVHAVYEGNHLNRVAERLEKTVLPFFAKNLK
jgi:enterochelin esterase-like enzyme